MLRIGSLLCSHSGLPTINFEHVLSTHGVILGRKKLMFNAAEVQEACHSLSVETGG